MDNKLWDCIVKRLSAEETAESAAMLDAWLIENRGHQEEYLKIQVLWKLTEKLPAQEQLDFEIVRERISETNPTPQLTLVDNAARWWKYGLAAAMTGIFLLTALFYYRSAQNSAQPEEWVLKSAGTGKMIRVLLPDSTLVWLNSGSEIRYERDFRNNKLRLVKLKGEAYFEVTHDSSHPFVVSSAGMNTTVYGTSFNVRAYNTERAMVVAVNSGKVGVTTSEDKKAVFLLPSEKLIYDREKAEAHKISISSSDVDSWVSGELIFEQTPFNEVFEALERKYNIKINTEKTNYTGCKLTARFRNKSINEVLKTLNLSMNIRSKFVGQTIYIEGGGSCSNNK
ncbi:FecR family protein [Pedobacter panaciterrae]|uniref:FecR family protein n=1 Tax=Pedobacter panaciterrae TaxID=363849 RepID=UPI00259A63B0|nr:FecR family protein [uncultured Pedobacter sp.]